MQMYTVFYITSISDVENESLQLLDIMCRMTHNPNSFIQVELYTLNVAQIGPCFCKLRFSHTQDIHIIGCVYCLKHMNCLWCGCIKIARFVNRHFFGLLATCVWLISCLQIITVTGVTIQFKLTLGLEWRHVQGLNLVYFFGINKVDSNLPLLAKTGKVTTLLQVLHWKLLVGPIRRLSVLGITTFTISIKRALARQLAVIFIILKAETCLLMLVELILSLAGDSDMNIGCYWLQLLVAGC